MLEALLRSWSSLIIPEEVTVTFLVIENDTEERSKDLIQTLHPIFKSSKLVYALETEPGIPFARNRAARESLKMESDILLFVDDDEEVASDWLEKIIQGYRSSKAKLIGAPLRARLPEENLTLLQRLMFTNIKSRYRKKEMRASRRAYGQVTTVSDHDGVRAKEGRRASIAIAHLLCGQAASLSLRMTVRPIAGKRITVCLH